MTQPPSGEIIRTAIDELRKDGSRWRAAAAELEAAAGAAKRLGLGQFEMSAPAAWAGLTDVYQQLQVRLATLLDEGTETMHGMGAALHQAADAYEADDNNSAHRLRGVW